MYWKVVLDQRIFFPDAYFFNIKENKVIFLPKFRLSIAGHFSKIDNFPNPSIKDIQKLNLFGFLITDDLVD